MAALDERTEHAIETTLELELLRNERVIEHPTLGAIRLRRPTANEDALIAEVRRKQYQRDLRDTDILSRDELLALAVKRGMWAPDLSDKIDDLTRKTGEMMGHLDMIGFKSVEELLKEFTATQQRLLDVYADDPAVAAVVPAYFDMTKKPTLAEHQAISGPAPTTEVDDLLDTADTLRTQIDMLNQMFEIRKELKHLTDKQARLYVDSLESRADREEELARVFYGAEKVTGGRVWATLEAMKNAPPQDVGFVLDELRLYVNGVDSRFRETLTKYGFLQRQTSTPASSGDSPALPPSNSAGESSERTPLPSSSPTESSPAPSTP